MSKSKVSWRLVIVVIGFVFSAIMSVQLQATIPAQERAALIALYNATSGDNWTNKTGWKTPPLDTDGFAMPGTEDSWSGITVSSDHIITIDLQSNNLTGVIPSQLENLEKLTILYLNDNKLSGSIPSQLGNLANLVELRLNINQLSGTIPTQLGNLAKLTLLYLYSNQLNGAIPTQLENLAGLQYLDLSANQLSGAILSQLGNLANLKELRLSKNQLSGTIPTQLGNLSNLAVLYIYSNQLSGAIPSQLGNLANLVDLRLNANQLSGSIPSRLGNLARLQYLYLATNQLTGSIPLELGNLAALKYLYFSYNQLTGSVPSGLGNLSNITYFTIDNNRLNGEFPSSFLNLTKCTTFNIKWNCGFTSSDPALITWLNTKNPRWDIDQYQCNLNSITVTSPNGGEIWAVGSIHAITWTTAGTIENVKIEYSIDNGSHWSTITSSTPNTGSYYWTVPNTPSTQCRVKITQVSGNTPSDTSDAVFTIRLPDTTPRISLNHYILHFGAFKDDKVKRQQSLMIRNSGGGNLEWSITTNASWLSCSPASGSGPGKIGVTVDSTGLPVGNYTGLITVTAPGADNSPLTVTVYMKVFENGNSSGPFGEMSTPTDGAIVRGSVAVTGWALDDVGISKVEVFNDSTYLGDAVMVDGARPDVESAFPDYPQNSSAGWGYMLLSNFLPDKGNGSFTLIVKATDAEGNQVTLGSKTIICDNATAVKPFGAIDTPTQGGDASGKNFVNFGWVLTPQPNNIPINGSTIDVVVDGVVKGHPKYNVYRSDIATLFPGFFNSMGAVGYYYLDTTKYSYGLHTIAWNVTDSAGNSEGIGSRYFSVINNEGIASLAGIASPCANVEPLNLYPNEGEAIHTEIEELERVEINLSNEDTNPNALKVDGYLVVGDELRELPIGSTLDTERGVFYWQPGPGFVGEYRLLFILKDQNGNSVKKEVTITITPKFKK